MKTRIPGYGEAHFKMIFQAIYYHHATGRYTEWKKALGYREKTFHVGDERLTPFGYIRSKISEELPEYPKTFEEYAIHLLSKRQGAGPEPDAAKVAKLVEGLEIDYQRELHKTEVRLVPTPGVLGFLPFVYGGRTETNVVGTIGQCAHYDFRSAYPTAMYCLGKDYSFLRTFMTTGSACAERVEKLLEGGPFQIAGIYISWIFKKDVEPIFPVKAEGRTFQGEKTETLIFPSSGSGHIMWPEAYVALSQGLLQSFIVHSVHEFEKLETNYMSAHFEYLMRLKNEDSYNVVKLLANSSFGKTLQGLASLREDPHNIEELSAFSCAAIGAYMLSLTKCCIGEVINRNPWLVIATDAIVLKGHGPITTGPVIDMVREKVAKLNVDFICQDFVATQGLVVRSRGYLLEGHKVKDGQISGPQTWKMAAMGMKVRKKSDPLTPGRMGLEQIEDYMTGLISGELKITNFQTFSSLQQQYEDQNKRRKEIQQELKNNRNAQSRLRISAGLSYETLKRRFEKNPPLDGQFFQDYEKEALQQFLDSRTPKANALKQLLSEYAALRSEYKALMARQIFSRKYFRTISVSTTYDFKRCPILETIKPDTFTLTYASSDGSSSKTFEFNHVQFQTRPLYSADEYRQLVLAAGRNMTPAQYEEMMEDLRFHGVLSSYHDLNGFRLRSDDNNDAETI